MEIDFKFDPKKFVYPENGVLPISHDIWNSLDNINGIPFTNKKFYVPRAELPADWNLRFNDKLGIKENVFYDPEIVNLSVLVNKDMISEFLSGLRPNDPILDMVKQNGGDLPEDIYLELYGQKLRWKISHAQTLAMLSDKEDEFKFELSDWQKKVLSWRRGYGHLVPMEDMHFGIFGASPKYDAVLANRVEGEYFFRVPRDYYSGIVLSLGVASDGGNAYWGFRRDLATDWPFRFDPKKEMSEHRKLLEMIAPMEPFVDKMNYLLVNLENVLKNL